MELEKLVTLIDQWKVLVAAIGALLAAIVAVRKALPDLDLRTWFSARNSRKAHASRLVDPDALKLNPELPQHLVGRDDDLKRLLSALSNPLVTLCGESGCGKSALLMAGVAKHPAFAQQFLPIYIDMSHLDWEDGPLGAVRDEFVRALPPDDPARASKLDALSSPREYAKTFGNYYSRTYRRPLLLLDQFDDYQAQPGHRGRFLPPDTRVWQNADSIARENAFWRMLRECLENGTVSIVVACRDDAVKGVASLRFRPEAQLDLPRLEQGRVRQIIDRLIERKTDQPMVITEPEGGWTELRDRLVDDLEGRGSVLPQQLKVALCGLRTLRRLTPDAYTRAGRVIGLEAAFINDAIARAAHTGGLRDDDVLQLLSRLVDRTRQPPDKGPSLSAGQLAQQDKSRENLPEDAIRRVLEQLKADEIVRTTSEVQDPTTGWQLDHAYLAQPILRIERERNRWEVELKERARLYAEAAWGKKWRALLPIGLQLQLAIASIRGRLRYGDYRGYALKSLARAVPAIAIPGLIASLAWAANEYNVARRIEGKMASSFYSSSDEPASALTDLSVRSWAVRWLIARDIFREPQHAEWFNRAPGPVIRAWVQLDPERMDSLVRSYATPAALRQTDARLRSAPEALVREASPTALTDATRAMLDRATSEILRQSLAPTQSSGDIIRVADPKAALGRFRSDAEPLREGDPLARPFLAGLREALEKTRGYELRALAQAYASVPDFADVEPSAAKVLASLREAIGEYGREKYMDLQSVVQAYVAVAARLKENEGIASAERSALRGAIGKVVDPVPLGALAQCYAAVTSKLQDFDAHAVEVMIALRTAIFKANTWPFFGVEPLANGYASMAAQLKDADPHAGEVLAAMRKAIGEKVAEKTELYGSANLFGLEDLALAYAAVATKLEVADPYASDVLAALRDAMAKIADLSRLGTLAQAYAAVAAKLDHAEPHVATVLITLRAAIIKSGRSPVPDDLARAYAALAAEFRPGDLHVPDELAALREDPYQLKALAQGYAAAAAKLEDPYTARELAAVREAITNTRDSDQLRVMVQCYAAVAATLTEADPLIAKELAALREVIVRTPLYGGGNLGAVTQAYALMAAKLQERDAHTLEVLAVLRQQIERGYVDEDLVRGYAAVATTLLNDDPYAVGELEALRVTIANSANRGQLGALAGSYAAVAAKQKDTDSRAVPVLAALSETIRTANPYQLKGLVQSYAAVAKIARTPTAPGRDIAILLGRIAELRSVDECAAFADAILAAMRLGWPPLAWEQAGLVVTAALLQPVSAGEPTRRLVSGYEELLRERSIPQKPKKSWSGDVWAFADWARENLPGFSPYQPNVGFLPSLALDTRQ